VALDRQSIARSDFPQARRGYDPAAVNRHLAAIADEVEELRRRAVPGAALAGQTSEQVRAIIEAAESSAAGIREGATAEAQGHVARVAEAADALRDRIDALERELTEVLGALRGGAERLRSQLDEVQAEAAGLAAASAEGRATDAHGAGPAPSEVAPSALGATVAEAAAAAGATGAGSAAEVGEEPPGTAVEEDAEPVGRSTDIAGARIVAFQWFMEGRSREDIDEYLAEHYDLPDRAGLIDHAQTIATRG
jgi:DivIVA domain-containing protein